MDADSAPANVDPAVQENSSIDSPSETTLPAADEVTQQPADQEAVVAAAPAEGAAHAPSSKPTSTRVSEAGEAADQQPLTAAADPLAEQHHEQKQEQVPIEAQGKAADAAADATPEHTEAADMAEAKHPVEPEHAAAAEEPNVPAAEVQQHRVSNSAHKAEHEPAEAPTNAPRKSEGGVTAAPAAAAVPAPAIVKKAPVASKPQEDEQQPAKVASPRHKETAVERLTTPTAMRMLKTLEQTQGGKAEWHIATGVPFKSKRLGPDEMSAMVDRLCTPKHAEDNMPPKLHAVKLTFEGNKEVLVPVKESTKEENVQYMASLYDRCQETRAKTKQTLEEKWLQPLIKPKQAAAK